MIFLYNIFINTVSAVLYCFIAQIIYKLQRDKRDYLKFILLGSVIFAILIIFEEYMPLGMQAISVVATLIVLSYLVLKLKVLQALVSAIIYIIALAVGDISAVVLLVKIYGYTIEQIKTILSLSITSDLVIYGTVIIIIFLMKLVSQTREMTDKYKRSISMKTSLYMLITFIVIIANYSMYFSYIDIIDKNILMINVAIMWLYLILSLYINFTNTALVLKEQQYDQQQDYISTIDSLINDYRRLKHSYANTIYSFYGYIQENDLEGLKKYYSEVMDETRKMDSNMLLALQKVKVYAVFGLLWKKIGEAESKGIEVGAQVVNEVREVGMKLSDLCEVLGNYLDNAIEAAAASDNKKMSIILNDDEGYLTIKVENTYNGEVDVRKIEGKGYSTKGEGRGYGLTIVRQIISRYSNVLHNTVAEDGVFRQELVIKK